MSKKSLMSLVFVLGAAFFLAGCGKDKAGESLPEESLTPENQQQEQDFGMMEEISPIVEAMNSGRKTRCEYLLSTEEGEMTSVVFLEGQKYKTQTQAGGKTQNALFDGESMYIWSEGEAEGMKLSTECARDLPGSVSEGETESFETDQDPEERFDGAFDVRCEPFSDFDLSLPQGVKFVDQCQLMKDTLKNLPSSQSLPGNLPQIPEGMPSL